MPALTTKQVRIVEKKIDAVGLHYTELRDEFLDHICTAIEEKTAAGMTFEAALASEFLEEDEMKLTEKDTLSLLQQKSIIMHRISSAALLLLLVFTFFQINSTDANVAPADPPSLYPLQGDFRITSAFGMRHHPIKKKEMLHKGTDFAAPFGTPVLAAADGKVILTETKDTGYGNNVKIAHDSVYQSRYAQLSEIKVREGQFVKKGEIIGLVGNSGSSTAPHLHYEVTKNGEHVDPEGFIAQK